MNKLFAYIFLMAGGLCLSQPGEAQKSTALYTAPLGIELYTFRKSFPIDPGKTLDTVKMLGFTELEGGPGRLSPEEFKKLCDERGINIIATGANYDELIKDAAAVAHRAKLLGADYIMCAWIPHKGELTFDDAKKAVDVFNDAGKVLKDSGITFCYHAHGYEFQPYKDGALLDYIIQNTNPKNVSFEMDIFWIQFGGGDPVTLLKKYGNRWKLMHLKDIREGTVKNLTGGTEAENDVALGAGEVDIAAILKEAKKVGIRHYFIEDESNLEMEHVPQSIIYLKGLKE